MELQAVIFDLAGELFGLDIHSVEGLIVASEIVKLSDTPDFLEGIMNVRGKNIPVIDLRKRIGLEPASYAPESRVILISINSSRIGVIVDSVSEVVRIPHEYLEPLPRFLTQGTAGFITGLAKWNSDLVNLVDLGSLLTPDEIKQVAIVYGEDGLI